MLEAKLNRAWIRHDLVQSVSILALAPSKDQLAGPLVGGFKHVLLFLETWVGYVGMIS